MESVRREEVVQLLPAPPTRTALGKAVEIATDVHEGHRPSDLAFPPLDAHFVFLHLRGSSRLRQERSGEAHEGATRPGNLIVMPAGQASRWAWTEPVDVAHFYVPPQQIARLADEMGLAKAPALHNEFGREDPSLSAALLTLARDEDQAGGTLYADTVARLALVRLLRFQGVVSLRPASPLARPEVIRACRYLRDRAGENVGLAEVATVVGLSPFHFARAFREAVGMPPHRFLLELRLDRALVLVRDTRLPLASVSSACGFADQSHMTRHFRRRYGVTPSTLRR